MDISEHQRYRVPALEEKGLWNGVFLQSKGFFSEDLSNFSSNFFMLFGNAKIAILSIKFKNFFKSLSNHILKNDLKLLL